jgi:hypothetical protein
VTKGLWVWGSIRRTLATLTLACLLVVVMSAGVARAAFPGLVPPQCGSNDIPSAGVHSPAEGVHVWCLLQGFGTFAITTHVVPVGGTLTATVSVPPSRGSRRHG